MVSNLTLMPFCSIVFVSVDVEIPIGYAAEDTDDNCKNNYEFEYPACHAADYNTNEECHQVPC